MSASILASFDSVRFSLTAPAGAPKAAMPGGKTVKHGTHTRSALLAKAAVKNVHQVQLDKAVALVAEKKCSTYLRSISFARGMSMTRVIAWMSRSWQDAPFTALELLSSIALERFGVAAGWPAILRRRRSVRCSPSSISPDPVSAPSSPHGRTPVQIPCARPRTYFCFRACLAMHTLTVVLSRLPATGVIPSKLAAQSRRRWHTAANRVALQVP